MLSPGPCTPNEAGICLDLIAKAGAEHPDPRRLPRPSGDRPGLRRRGGARARADAWQAVATSSIRARASSAASTAPFEATRYHSLVVERDTLPADLEVDRRDRRWPGHGAVAQDAAGARRAVPSREHRLRAWPPDPEELPRPRRRLERDAASAGRRIEDDAVDGRRVQGAHRQGRHRRRAHARRGGARLRPHDVGRGDARRRSAAS